MTLTTLPPGLKQYAGQLLLIDTLSGNKQVLEDGNCQLLQPSPDRRWLAFFKRIATLAPDPEQPYSVRQKKQLMIADMQSLTVRKIVTTIDSGSLTWSPDSKQVAFLAKPIAASGSFQKALCCNLIWGKINEVADGRFQPAAITWSANIELLIIIIEDDDKDFMETT